MTTWLAETSSIDFWLALFIALVITAAPALILVVDSSFLTRPRFDVGRYCFSTGATCRVSGFFVFFFFLSELDDELELDLLSLFFFLSFLTLAAEWSLE